MEKEEQEADAMLGTDAINKVYIAVLSGRPDPIGTQQSNLLYEQIKEEVANAPKGTQWVIPNE